MAAPVLSRSLSTRAVKKLEKPRPLKISASQSKIPSEPSPRVSLQDLMTLVENVSQCLQDKNFDDTLISNIAIMHSSLKTYGPQLESIYKDQLDRAFVIFRDGCQDDNLIITTRLLLLELVELRGNHWSYGNIQIYYSAKMAASEIEALATTPEANTTSSVPTAPSPPITPVLSPGEVLKTSGKFPKPTKIAGKNYCKDEVVIRNSDSGKVNPGAKERLVQITGPSEDKIVHARQLMEDTIRRNASPVREVSERGHMGGSSSSLNSSASDESGLLNQSGSRRSALLHSFSGTDAGASLGEYKYTVNLGNETVKVIGSNYETVRNAKLVLEEYYNSWIQRNCMGDCYGLEEDVFVDPVVEDMSMMRLNSLDSVTGLDPGLDYIPQPLYPMAQPERRPVLGRSNSMTSPMTSPIQGSGQSGGLCRKYSRAFLLECALSKNSKVTPPNWDQIVAECPAIAKKANPPFDPRAYAKRDRCPTGSIISASQSNDADSE